MFQDDLSLEIRRFDFEGIESAIISTAAQFSPLTRTRGMCILFFSYRIRLQRDRYFLFAFLIKRSAVAIEKNLTLVKTCIKANCCKKLGANSYFATLRILSKKIPCIFLNIDVSAHFYIFFWMNMTIFIDV